ncbi:MAG: DUF4435 domain-containing protein [Saprospiraceae bacterium]|nr:DUF4435 domain-containing protein [Saprospiraceae bacterium]
MYFHQTPIETTISNFCRKKLDLSAEFNTWHSEFSENVYDLIVLDIANSRFKKGVSIFGDNCFRFLSNKHSYKICENRVKKFKDSIKDKFSEDELNAVKELIYKSEKDLWFMIKGHFITHALINLIKYTVRKYSGDTKSLTLDFYIQLQLIVHKIGKTE